MADIEFEDFIWDENKEAENLWKHGVDFLTAAKAFEDPHRKFFRDPDHSANEERLYCLGCVEGKVLTVRFVCRGGKFRIFGAGYWRKGREIYSET